MTLTTTMLVMMMMMIKCDLLPPCCPHLRSVLDHRPTRPEPMAWIRKVSRHAILEVDKAETIPRRSASSAIRSTPMKTCQIHLRPSAETDRQNDTSRCVVRAETPLIQDSVRAWIIPALLLGFPALGSSSATPSVPLALWWRGSEEQEIRGDGAGTGSVVILADLSLSCDILCGPTGGNEL